MLLILFLISFPILIITSQLMIITWGVPGANQMSYTYPLTWKSCINYCLASAECVYIRKNSENNCTVFNIQQSMSVEKLAKGSGKVIGIKFKTSGNDSDDNGCPASDDGLFENYALNMGLSSYYLVYSMYNIIFDKFSSTYNFSITASYQCPGGAMFSPRPKGLWCMLVYRHPSAFAQKSSSSMCSDYMKQFGGVDGRVSAIETSEEYSYVEGMIIRNNNAYPKTGIWLDGTRKSTCKYPVQSDECNGAREFTFTDPTFTLPGYFQWAKNKPSGSLDQSKKTNCLMMAVSGSNVTVSDRYCDSSTYSGITMGGAVCGCRASEFE